MVKTDSAHKRPAGGSVWRARFIGATEQPRTDHGPSGFGAPCTLKEWVLDSPVMGTQFQRRSAERATLKGRKGVQEFLNSKSMLTPGAAGATTTLITGTLVSQFGLPGNWTGLATSFLIGLIVWADKSLPVVQRLFVYVVSSMVIFSVAIGLNEAGRAATQPKQPPGYQTREVPREAPPQKEAKPFFQSWFQRQGETR